MKRALIIPKPRNFYKIPKDIGLIPAGVYQLDGIDAMGVNFRIEDRVRFRIFNHKLLKLVELPPARAHGARTSPEEFATRAKQLLVRLRSRSPEIIAKTPRTLCYIHPQVRCLPEELVRSKPVRRARSGKAKRKARGGVRKRARGVTRVR